MTKQSLTGDLRPYIIGAAFFLATLALILSTPAVMGRSSDYADAVLDQYMLLGNNVQIAMVDRQYDPENQALRLDFYVQNSSTSSTTLTNLTYTAGADTLRGKTTLTPEVYRVNESYFVVVIYDLPPGWDVTALTIYPEYIYPELETADYMSDRQLKLYINETEELVARAPIVAGTIDDYILDYYDTELRLIDGSIDDLREQILQKEEAVFQAEDMIYTLQQEKKYQTQQDAEETERKISRYASTIESYEETIENLHEQIELLEEKAVLIEAKKADLG